MAIKLRDYQSRAIDDIRSAFAAGSRAPLFVLPTGGGKTTVFGEISRRTVAGGRRVMVLAHRRELIDQAAARLRLLGLDPGIIAAGDPEQLDKPAQVASVQTLIRRLNRVMAPELLIIDEAHHAPAGQWAAVRAAWPQARCLGVTATPVRLDGRGLSESFDRLILGPSVRELTSAGHLMRPDVYAPSVPDLAGVRTRGGDYAPEDLEQAMARSAIVGDAVSSFQEHVPTGTGIAFCSSVEHARRTAEAFEAAGIPAAVLSGDAKPTHRSDLIRKLASGELRILASVDVVSEGFDLPSISAAILLRPTKSLGLYIQQVGRVLRPADGKARAVVLDHAGNALRHGLPGEDRVWSLDGAPQRRSRDQATDGTALSVRQCPTCYGVHESAPICPYCGHVHQAETRVSIERAGELRLLEEAEARRLAAERTRLRLDQEKGEKTLADWLRLAEERGYDPRWAQMRHKLRQQRRRRAA